MYTDAHESGCIHLPSILSFATRAVCMCVAGQYTLRIADTFSLFMMYELHCSANAFFEATGLF